MPWRGELCSLDWLGAGEIGEPRTARWIALAFLFLMSAVGTFTAGGVAPDADVACVDVEPERAPGAEEDPELEEDRDQEDDVVALRSLAVADLGGRSRARANLDPSRLPSGVTEDPFRPPITGCS